MSTAGHARLGIIGDVHAECARLEAALDHLLASGVDAILCTGDVADGKGCVERCCALLAEAGALCVAGNHERWILNDRVRHIPDAHRREALGDAARAFLEALPPVREVPTVRGPLLLCHGVGETDHRKVWPGSPRMPVERSEELDALIAEDHYRFVINGHLHYRMILDFERLTLINGGTLKRTHRPGFLELDLDLGVVTFLGFEEDLTVREQDRHDLDDHGRRVFRDTGCFDGRWTPFPLYA